MTDQPETCKQKVFDVIDALWGYAEAVVDLKDEVSKVDDAYDDLDEMVDAFNTQTGDVIL